MLAKALGPASVTKEAVRKRLEMDSAGKPTRNIDDVVRCRGYSHNSTSNGYWKDFGPIKPCHTVDKTICIEKVRIVINSDV